MSKNTNELKTRTPPMSSSVRGDAVRRLMETKSERGSRRGHSGVKGVMCIHQPLRAGVVQIRQRAFLEGLRGVLVAGNGALGISRDRLVDPVLCQNSALLK